ncbi:MAG: biopolymer transporter ExbD [Sneathiellales bacterium]|nr:biopolymer transporter ExbD [Sneathiellales bacterium]
MSLQSKSLQHSGRRVKISLTPLIDVVFILLVFFMLASSFEKQHLVELVTPALGKKSSAPKDVDLVTIEIAGSDQFLVGQKTFSLNQLGEFMQANKESAFLLKTRKEAHTQDAVSLLDLAASLEIKKLRFAPVTQKEKE